MEELIVNCRTGKVTSRKLTPEEEQKWLAEAAQREQIERGERTAIVKSLLPGAMADLEQAQTLATEGTFTAEDVARCQAQVDKLLAELQKVVTK